MSLMRARSGVVVGLVLMAAMGCAEKAGQGPGQQAGAGGAGAGAQTPRRAVVDTYHGVKVTDEYRWLEDWSDPAVKSWSDAQNERARKHLDALAGVQEIRERITALRAGEGAAPEYFALAHRTGGGEPMLFAMKSQPPLEQPLLVVMPSAEEPQKERVVLDLNKLDPEGGTSLDFYRPSWDGSMVAVSLSEGGTESGTVYIYETKTGNRMGDVVPRVNGGTAGGDVAWARDDSGFYYTRYPPPGERAKEDLHAYQQVYFHQIGTPAESDTYEIGKEFPRIALVELDTSPAQPTVVATVAIGDGGEYEHWFKTDAGAWKRGTVAGHRFTKAKMWDPDYIALLLVKELPSHWLSLFPMSDPQPATAEFIIRDRNPKSVLEDWERTDNHLFVLSNAAGFHEVRVLDTRGGDMGFVPLPPASAVGQVEHAGGETVLFQNESYTLAPAWYGVSASDVTPRKLPISKDSKVSFEDAEVVREFATSKDGTKVPVTILKKKGTVLDGNNPTLLYGYGGFGVSIMPWFDEARRFWLDRGGVFAVATIRGGGEFGAPWHDAGQLTKKQNVFDDFHAAMERLKELKYTNSEKLALIGGSNGGLLMGAMITQHPADFRAAVAEVGIYDMLRHEVSNNGQFNTTEYGTSENDEQFRAMYAYSPYHHVKDGTAYPAVLFMTGANDPRVDPMQSRKMVARLQAASTSGRPILLRTSANAGHGGGSSLSHRVERDVDIYSFLMSELGMGTESKPAR